MCINMTIQVRHSLYHVNTLHNPCYNGVMFVCAVGDGAVFQDVQNNPGCRNIC